MPFGSAHYRGISTCTDGKVREGVGNRGRPAWPRASRAYTRLSVYRSRTRFTAILLTNIGVVVTPLYELPWHAAVPPRSTASPLALSSTAIAISISNRMVIVGDREHATIHRTCPVFWPRDSLPTTAILSFSYLLCFCAARFCNAYKPCLPVSRLHHASMCPRLLNYT